MRVNKLSLNKMSLFIGPNENAFCNEVPIEIVYDSNTPTLNKRLTGTAHPRTLVKPTIVAPMTDIDSWRTNPSVQHSQINKKTIKNLSLSGFNLPEERDRCAQIGDDINVWPVIDAVPMQPSIYTSTDIYQPINSSLGISYAPQFPNTTFKTTLGNNTIYRDTNTGTAYIRAQEPEFIYTNDGPSGVYDPRFTGYGDARLSYYDEALGVQKFYYDDINAVRMPNYITRNKLDSCVTPFGDAYGNIQSGHASLADTKRFAEASWVQNSLAFREDLSKSLMRKKNEEMVQRRQAPKYTLF